MCANEIYSNSTLFQSIMQDTVENIRKTCDINDNATIDLLLKSWMSKMESVVVCTLPLQRGRKVRKKSPCSTTRRKRCNGNVRPKISLTHKPAPKRIRKSNDYNVQSPTTSTGSSSCVSMPCLNCNEAAELCTCLLKHPTVICSNTVTENEIMPRYPKVKLVRLIKRNCEMKLIKVPLPLRIKHINEKRTCKILVPLAWRTKLKEILTPFISQVAPYSTSRAALMLQNYIDRYSSSDVPQVDGSSDFTVNFRIRDSTPVELQLSKSFETSDVDSGDDYTDEENSDTTFDCDNVVICQFNKVAHRGKRWRMDLKHGIMHICGKEYAFHEAKCSTTF